MKREDVTEVHCIQPIENLPSLVRRGILSNEAARAVTHSSVANPDVQRLRAGVTLTLADGTSRRLHSYANLYFDARNPMMYFLCANGDHADLCVLRVDKAVLDLPGDIISDRNAASGVASFHLSPAGLSKLSADRVFAHYWTDSDPIVQQEKKQARCAELLVPDRVDPKFMIGIYSSCSVSAARVRHSAPEVPCHIQPSLFFR
jgi:hypothetical protein